LCGDSGREWRYVKVRKVKRTNGKLISRGNNSRIQKSRKTWGSPGEWLEMAKEQFAQRGKSKM